MKFNLRVLHLEVNIFSSFFFFKNRKFNICLTNLNTFSQKNKKIEIQRFMDFKLF